MAAQPLLEQGSRAERSTGKERRHGMSHASKKAKGAVEELGGKIEQTVGKVLGNEKMEAEGRAHKVEGHAKHEAVETAERVKDKVDEIKSEAHVKAHH
jgi:uncharacterized protein YjbJ (UPF0337 family)